MLSERLMALAMIASLAACESDVQPVAEVPSESAAEQIAPEPAAEQNAPKPDRFANMYVDEVNQSYSPGLQIGETFPSIRALYQGEEITSIDRFIHDRAAIFIAVRSVDW